MTAKVFTVISRKSQDDQSQGCHIGEPQHDRSMDCHDEIRIWKTNLL